MAIFGIGANYDGSDVSKDFISSGVAGHGYPITEAPELHQYISQLKVGDIVYLKSANPSSDITVKAIGFVINAEIVSNKTVTAGRNVKWVVTEPFVIAKPTERNNVRFNTMYEEFHPDVQAVILANLCEVVL